MRKRRAWLIVFLAAALFVALWWARAFLLAQLGEAYFRAHGIQASLSFRTVSLSGVTGRFALGPKGAPVLAAQRIELHFDPTRFLPYVTDVRLVRPVVRAKIGPDGSVSLGQLQNWIASLGQGGGGPQFVSPGLKLSLTGLSLIADTPAGPLEWDGDIRVAGNVPVSAHLSVKPALLKWKGIALALTSANLDYQGPQASLRIAGSVRRGALGVGKLAAEIDAAGLTWDGRQIRAQSARFLASGQVSQAGASPAHVRLALGASNLLLGTHASHADLRLKASGGAEVTLAALAAFDPLWARALQGNLAQMNLDAAAHLEIEGHKVDGRLTEPFTAEGAKGAVLQLPMLDFSYAGGEADADFQLALDGQNLPSLAAKVRHLVWRGGELTAQTRFHAGFDHGAFRGVRLAADGALHWNGKAYSFAPADCSLFTLKAFRGGAKDLVRDVSARLCGQGKALLSGTGAQWRLNARAVEARAVLPAAASALDGMAARLSFQGEGSRFSGHVAIEKARLSDRAPTLRFHPLSGSGVVEDRDGRWQGRIALSTAKGVFLGEVQFRHAMAQGVGSAHISAPHLSFAAKGFQPQDLSPLLAMLRDAQGKASFAGDVNWAPQRIDSRGVLDVQGLEFVTPLGRAHDLRTRIAFSSLLPPRTDGPIPLSLARIDWALPIGNLAMRFALDPSKVEVKALSLDWAQGQVSLAPFSIPLGASPHFSATAQLKGISLESLLDATNLGTKVKVSGKVSGTVPFSVGAKGIRVANGHIAAAGPGRLSVDRSLWMQGDAAISSNAVEGFAYQALENLAYDSLSATLNSVPGGRLEALFHIKGKSAPPKPQTARVAILDILNGTALYKPIPLPSGTPIDLTLDTSLNFDELLKSYAQAWSEALHPYAAK